MGILHGCKRSYVIIRPKFVVGAENQSTLDVLQCKCNAENTNSPETQ